MQKNYYLCKLLCQHKKGGIQRHKMAKRYLTGVLPTGRQSYKNLLNFETYILKISNLCAAYRSLRNTLLRHHKCWSRKSWSLPDHR